MQRNRSDKHTDSLRARDLASFVEVTTRIMNQTSWQVRPMNAGFRNRAIATCRFCTDPTVQLPHTYIIREEEIIIIIIIIISLFWETLNDTIAQSIDVVMYNITKFANEHSKLQTVQTSVQQQLREISYNRSAHSIIL